jgi:ADP-ribose pyrophosphatase
VSEGSFEIVDRRTVARGSLVELEELKVRSESGDQFTRDVVRHPGGVAILAIEAGQVWLIRQHRVAVGGEIDEIPAGTLDGDDPDHESAARRELLEELGATAGRLDRLATMAPSPGYTSEVIEIFLAEDLEFGERSPDGEEEQHATVFSMPVVEALDSIDRGELTDAKTLVALLQWKRRQG